MYEVSGSEIQKSEIFGNYCMLESLQKSDRNETFVWYDSKGTHFLQQDDVIGVRIERPSTAWLIDTYLKMYSLI